MEISAFGAPIDGVNGVLEQAGPERIRSGSFIPATGTMEFDTADLKSMERNGTLGDVITHEMGHVLGFGTIWSDKRVLTGAGTRKPLFTGAAAKKEYAKLLKKPMPQSVPLENTGGEGTADSHW